MADSCSAVQPGPDRPSYPSSCPLQMIAISTRAKTCQDLWFSYGVTPAYEPVPPLSWNAYAKDWVRRHELPGDFAILTHRHPAGDPAGDHRMEIINL